MEEDSKIVIFTPTESGEEVIVFDCWLNIEPVKVVEYLELNNIPKYYWDLDDDYYYENIIYYDISFGNWIYITTPVAMLEEARKLVENIPRRYDFLTSTTPPEKDK
jgi:hypothetical protein